MMAFRRRYLRIWGKLSKKYYFINILTCIKAIYKILKMINNYKLF